MTRHDVQLRAGRILTPSETLSDATLVITDGIIQEISPDVGGFNARKSLHFPDTVAVPGFIDVHCHGYGGNSTQSGDRTDLRNIAESVAQHGVTTVFPTAEADTRESLFDIVQAFGAVADQEYLGADLGGLHLEGPYLSEKKAGMMDPDTLRAPDLQEWEELVSCSNGRIEKITIAPELPGAPELIERADAEDIVVSAGHTNATYDEANRGFDAGISSVTHLYNAMRQFHHRQPGILGAAVTRGDIYGELIADFVHLHPAALELAFETLGVDRCLLITDSTAVTGLPDGEYIRQNHTLVVEDGSCRVKESGVLAGSTLTMDEAVKNILREFDCGLRDVVQMASANPAHSHSLSDRGRLTQGSRGDITLLDNDYNVVATVVGGEVTYQRDNSG